MIDQTDWRGGDYKMTDLISRLHSRPDRDAFSDVTFILPDDSQLKAHKLVLAMASPVFESQFYGPLVNCSNNNPVAIKDVDSTAFRRLIDCIYRSSTNFLKTEINIKEHFQDYWLLLQAAHMFLVSNVMEDVSSYYICEHIDDMFYKNKAQQYIPENIPNLIYLVDFMNQACELSIYDEIADKGSECVVNQLPEIVERDILNKFSDNSINRIVKAFNRGVCWAGEVVASLDLVSGIQRNSYHSPGILQKCLKRLGREMEIEWETKDAWIRDLKSNENVD